MLGCHGTKAYYMRYAVSTMRNGKTALCDVPHMRRYRPMAHVCRLIQPWAVIGTVPNTRQESEEILRANPEGDPGWEMEKLAYGQERRVIQAGERGLGAISASLGNARFIVGRHVVGRHIFSCDTGATPSRPSFGRDFAVDTEGQIIRIRV
jgi:hypothetical protein